VSRASPEATVFATCIALRIAGNDEATLANAGNHLQLFS